MSPIVRKGREDMLKKQKFKISKKDIKKDEFEKECLSKKQPKLNEKVNSYMPYANIAAVISGIIDNLD